eukprot:gene13664-biopygen5042
MRTVARTSAPRCVGSGTRHTEMRQWRGGTPHRALQQGTGGGQAGRERGHCAGGQRARRAAQPTARVRQLQPPRRAQERMSAAAGPAQGRRLWRGVGIYSGSGFRVRCNQHGAGRD